MPWPPPRDTSVQAAKDRKKPNPRDPKNTIGQAEAISPELPIGTQMTSFPLQTPEGVQVPTRQEAPGPDDVWAEQRRRLLHEFWSKGWLKNYTNEADPLVDSMLERELARRGVFSQGAIADLKDNPEDDDAADNADQTPEETMTRLLMRKYQ